HLASLHGLAALVERVGNPAHDISRHRGIDFAGEFNEPGGTVVLTSDPGEVKRINRNAVSAKSRSRVERLESEWLGLRRVDDFPHVDAHALVENLQFIHQGNVYGPIGVLQDLARFGDFAATDTDYRLDELAVELCGEFEAGLVDAADYLRNGRSSKA